jgi:ATP-binding cassette subfamily B protein
LWAVGPCWPGWQAQLIPAIGSGDVAKVLQVVGLALAVFMLQKVAQFGQDTLLAGPALQVSQDLRSQLFARLQRLEFGALEKLSAGDLTYRLTEDADRVGEVIYKTIQDSTPCVLQLVAVFGYMVWLDWRLSLGTLVLAPWWPCWSACLAPG